MKNAQELSQYISQKFNSLKTNTEQRIFIENFYSHKVLERAELYSIADMLYQLNNLWMLSEFLHQNRPIRNIQVFLLLQIP